MSDPQLPPLVLGGRRVGADRWRFAVWAPEAERVALVLEAPGASAQPPGSAALPQSGGEPGAAEHEMSPMGGLLPELVPPLEGGPGVRDAGAGYWVVEIDWPAEIDRAAEIRAAEIRAAGIDAAATGRSRSRLPRYRFRLDGGELLADPASRSQPDDVFGPSQVFVPEPSRRSRGTGRALEDYVIYELHVGAFTEEGTLDAAIDELDELMALGVTAVELMPLAEFPGARNWGYDGVFPFSVESSYGGPAALVRFVDACHARGLSVVLDVVYNHLGPEGNVLGRFGPYFTDRYRTPWGDALNFDGAGSDGVRRYFVENGLYWLFELGVDALRLDAVHAIADESERPFLAELSAAVDHWSRALGERRHLFAESALNTRGFLRSREQGGCGFDGQWCDDFHHALHVSLTGEQVGYYVDFDGLPSLADALQNGFVYRGQHSTFRGRRHGVPSRGLDGSRLVVCAQNHDQVGNRPRGERLAGLVEHEDLKLSAALLLLSPFVPLLFMGEEDADESPFLYFVDHHDPELLRAVRDGRCEEHSGFSAAGVPDPGALETYTSSKRRRPEEGDRRRLSLRALYARLLELRRSHSALGTGALESVKAGTARRLLVLERRSPARSARDSPGRASGGRVVGIFSFERGPSTLDLEGRDGPAKSAGGSLPDIDAAGLELLLDSSAAEWGGPGSRAPTRLAAAGALEIPGPGFLLYGTPSR
ncbi:MAG TPA: malto-oligosyltrehalose trehalohydrolase [Thermoanaerobaculia bacterium]|nr:malto-oligosyltrehalose trehalohydrolase [Thermoanaerobaculia bacterium]